MRRKQMDPKRFIESNYVDTLYSIYTIPLCVGCCSCCSYESHTEVKLISPHPRRVYRANSPESPWNATFFFRLLYLLQQNRLQHAWVSETDLYKESHFCIPRAGAERTINDQLSQLSCAASLLPLHYITPSCLCLQWLSIKKYIIQFRILPFSRSKSRSY